MEKILMLYRDRYNEENARDDTGTTLNKAQRAWLDAEQDALEAIRIKKFSEQNSDNQ